MKISVFCLVLNLVLAVWLVRHFEEAHLGGEVGLAAANTISASCNVVLLLYALRRKLGLLGLRALRTPLLTLLGGAVLAGATAAALSWTWTRYLGHATLPLKLGEVFVPMTVGGLVYGVMAVTCKIPVAGEMAALITKKLKRLRA